MPRTKFIYLCTSLVNTLFLNQYWTTWKPEWGVITLECFSTLCQHAFCAFLHVGLTVYELLFLLGVMGLCYVPKEHRWHPEALVNALSSNTECVRNLQIWNEIHLSIKAKLLGWGSQLEKEQKYWDKVSVKCSLPVIHYYFTLRSIIFLSFIKY